MHRLSGRRAGASHGSDWVGDGRWDGSGHRPGGRVALFRYGTEDRLFPQGVEFELEAAAFPRLQLNEMRDLVAADYRAGGVFATKQGPWETKFGFYHLSSHLGDQYMLENPDVERVNFSRNPA